MSGHIWGIRARLVTGETRWLENSYGVDSSDETVAALLDFEKRQGAFAGEWLETSASSQIARAHIVEIDIAPKSD